ncbi:hypothetical protein ANCDUO_00299 [Ancylostoma duodenale]|uniref:Uncharacterized protein n=1 Tax=Ancylostoma duodenale TaxID=51022 RepID=A0A0C2HIG0_9BILA|nr:hypothetical protein ANCDUO_00299 [Ancylostoma duodenale]
MYPNNSNIPCVIQASRFHQAAELSAPARSFGLVQVGSIIANALNADRLDTAINMYRTEVMKFQAWKQKQSPTLNIFPSPKSRDLYLAKCDGEGRQKALPLITAALNYFCGQLTGIDEEIQASILEAEKRITPPAQHRAKIDQCSLRNLMLLGTSSTDPTLTQATTKDKMLFVFLGRTGSTGRLWHARGTNGKIAGAFSVHPKIKGVKVIKERDIFQVEISEFDEKLVHINMNGEAVQSFAHDTRNFNG